MFGCLWFDGVFFSLDVCACVWDDGVCLCVGWAGGWGEGGCRCVGRSGGGGDEEESMFGGVCAVWVVRAVSRGCGCEHLPSYQRTALVVIVCSLQSP